jgi:lysyl-tRNA synthetase class 2
MTFTEELMTAVAQQAIGTDRLTFGHHQISLAAPYARLSLREGTREAASRRLNEEVTEADLRDGERAKAVADQLGVEVKQGDGAGTITTLIFEALCEHQLVQPTFVYDFPTEVSPLSKQKSNDPDTVERIAPGATSKRTRWTRITSGRSNTACHRPPARGSASTGW